MNIILKSITLENFKGIKSLTVGFSLNTKILGANRSGKTTIFDAFTWLLFGKDSTDRKDFSIKTLDKDGNVKEKLDHMVMGILEIDSRIVKLARVYREKWVKSRGKEKAELQGHETLYFIDDVPRQQGEYQQYISSLIPEDLFKLLTNPLYFNNLNWKQRREMLEKIAPKPDESQITGGDIAIAELLEYMRDERKSLDDIRRRNAASRKTITEELSLIPARIDEATRAIPDALDFDEISRQINLKKMELQTIDQQIADSSKAYEQQIQQRKEALSARAKIEEQIDGIRHSYQRKLNDSIRLKDDTIRRLNQDRITAQDAIALADINIKNLQRDIETLNQHNENLRKEWAQVNAREFKYNGYNCPTCGQPYPDELVDMQEQQALDKFNTQKDQDMQAINRKGISNKQTIEQLADQIEQLMMKVGIHQDAVIRIETELEEASKPVQSISIDAMMSQDPQYLQLSEQLINHVIPIVEVQATADDSVRTQLRAEIEQLQKQYNTKEQIEKANMRIDELKDREQVLAQQLSDLERVENTVERYAKLMSEAVEQSVNSMFSLVKFRMFNQLVNGGEEPACECLVEGVPWQDANNAGKINSGIDIINTFSRVHGISAPIFADNAEAVNTMWATQSQLIQLIVTEDAVLKVII